MDIQELSILIPAYNEEATIRNILDRVLSVTLQNNIKKEIIVVNDCSKDQTQSIVESFIAEHPGEIIRLFNQPKNQGKGAAIHKAIELATGDAWLSRTQI